MSGSDERRRRAAKAGIAAAIALGLALPSSSAFGAVTIGAKLESLTPLVGAYNCDVPNCTLINSALGPANTAPGGLTSPVTGTITGFRVRTGVDPAIAVELRVVRGSGTTFTGAGTAPPVSQAANLTVLHPVSLPIRAGDSIGLNCCSGNDGVTSMSVPGSGTFLGWGTGANLLLADGETRAFDTEHTDDVLMMNADVEPTNTFTINRARARKGKVRFNVTVPNDGILTIRPFGRDLKKCGTPKCGRKTRNVTQGVAGGTTVNLLAAASKSVRSHVREFGSYRFRVRLTYTPEFGASSFQTRRVTLKG